MRYHIGKKIYRIGICAVLSVFLLFGQIAFAETASSDTSKQTTSSDTANQEYYQGIKDMIQDEYGGSITDGQLTQGAVDGMLNSLDPFSTYFTPKEAEDYYSSVSGVFAGIGITMGVTGDYIFISQVFPGSPAEKAGILQGDKIVQAEGKSLVKATADTAAAIIRGQAGTKVKIGILRDGSSTVKTFNITRETIKVNPVTYEIRNGIGYIKLDSFNEGTDENIKKALTAMDKSKITKIILDLRNNPGGEVEQAVALCQHFVPKGLITKLDFKSKLYRDVEYNSDLAKTKYKLAVLVNENSASASEIVSGAIQDTGVGKLIGTKTYGKAKVQNMFPVLTQAAYENYKQKLGVSVINGDELKLYGINPDKSEIMGYAKMTVGYYYTPKGRMIDGKGLIPDIAVGDPKAVSNIDVISIQKLTNTTSPGLNGMGIDVYNAEKILRILGYTTGQLDTTLDSATLKAIKDYQKKAKLTVTGKLDSKTQNALNAELGKIIVKYDKQYNTAVQQLGK